MIKSQIKNIRFKIQWFAIGFTILCIIATVIIAILPIFKYTKEIKREQQDQVRDVSVLIINEYIEKNIEISKQISSRTRAKNLSLEFESKKIDQNTFNPSLSEILSAAADGSSYIKNITRIGLNTNTITTVGDKLFDKELLHKRKISSIRIVEYEIIKKNNNYYMMILSPVIYNKTNLLAIDIIFFDMYELRKIIEKRVHFENLSISFILDNNLNAFYTNTMYNLNNKMFSDLLLKLVDSKDSGVISKIINGQHLTISYASSNLKNFLVYTAGEELTFIQYFKGFLLYILVIVIISSFGLILLLRRLLGNLSKELLLLDKELKKELKKTKFSLIDIKTKSKLKKEVNWLYSIVNTTVDGLITIDKAGIIQTFNMACESMFGYKAHEVIGQNVNILMPEPYHSEHDTYLSNYHKTNEAKVIGIGRQAEGKHKDGSIFPIDLSVARVTAGKNVFYSGIVRDITEKNKNEVMKNEFISVVSHELRTPLTSIYGSLGLILGTMKSSLPDKAFKLLKTAYRNSNHLIMLVKDILDIDKIAAGKMKFYMKSESINSMIDEALNANAAYADEYNIEVNFTPCVDDIKIKIDYDRFLQIFFNLFSNAVKFSSKGGTINIYSTIKKNKIRVHIHDFGAGIPKEFRKNIFQKFSQADSSETRSKNGTGLGLYISKKLVEGMGGKIGFQSNKGEGTIFWFQFEVYKKT